MNNKYLWDRTGEPDPEIQELEELLGTLRYQPRPLRIPANLSVARRRPFFLPVTIAAAIIMLALLSALWFHFSRQPAAPPLAVKRESSPTPAPGVNQPQKAVIAEDQSNPPQRLPQKTRNLVATNQRSNAKKRSLPPQLTPEEQAEKEQVLVALRLVSAKLNLAQRKTLGTPPANAIRNQHKIG